MILWQLACEINWNCEKMEYRVSEMHTAFRPLNSEDERMYSNATNDLAEELEAEAIAFFARRWGFAETL
jgi:hypothetical protein